MSDEGSTPPPAPIHNCLDAPPGEKHCIVCHQQGHHYNEHWGLLGRSPELHPFMNPTKETR